ncbi:MULTISPECIES: hypothetical protein [unclassified Paenibacillus]|uniref:hypothetical protein n=1 Tax=unclassified Paenibacillus TaxID=185978 RepID=UPI00278072D7|nr:MULTISPECIES: hypothetical protein [unclassified Paenibacillus]MDQ0903129.1 hypothetical protein [Paenibacillus sp. V4I7]MDQ0918395.1 hypothetical protein [Paenibacillus sp. V4I5]
MATPDIDYTQPDVQYFFDVNKNRLKTNPELLRKTLKPLDNQTIVIGPTDECVSEMHKRQAYPSYANTTSHPHAAPQYQHPTKQL